MNTVLLVGYVKSQDEKLTLRYTVGNYPYVNFYLVSLVPVAIGRQGKQRRWTFCICRIFGVSAERFVHYAHNGDMVSLEGFIVSEAYKPKKGEKAGLMRTYVSVSQVHWTKHRNGIKSDDENTGVNTQEPDLPPPQEQEEDMSGYVDTLPSWGGLKFGKD